MPSTSGTCRLTGAHGRYVRSHLIPKALTRPAIQGAPFIQAAPGRRPVRCFGSWFDRELVTREGEDILEYLDTLAIAEMRRLKLLWSAPFTDPPSDGTRAISEIVAMRRIRGVNGPVLRRFLLSLPWRAAATKRPGFEDIALRGDELEHLGDLVTGRRTADQDFYPVTLMQLLPPCEARNMAPIALTLPEVGEPGNPSSTLSGSRFYFDGLVANFQRPEPFATDTDGSGVEFVGGDTLVVGLIDFRSSFQKKNNDLVIAESNVAWPDVMKKLWLGRLGASMRKSSK